MNGLKNQSSGFIYVKLFSRSCSHSLVGYSPSQLVLTHVAPRCMHADSDCVLNLQLGEVLSVKTLEYVVCLRNP